VRHRVFGHEEVAAHIDRHDPVPVVDPHLCQPGADRPGDPRATDHGIQLPVPLDDGADGSLDLGLDRDVCWHREHLGWVGRSVEDGDPRPLVDERVNAGAPDPGSSAGDHHDALL
jgi:hypothetical protein